MVSPRGREAKKYQVVIGGKPYPHKHLISIAHRLWRGEEWPVSRFVGGWDQTIPYLIKKGFEVRSLSGEQIALNEQRQGRDFSPALKEFLESKFKVVVKKGQGRSRLVFGSGATIHVRGSKKLPGGAFYYLQEEDYASILGYPDWFFTAVYGDPATTFVIPKGKLKAIFDGIPLTKQRGKKPKWYFDIKDFKPEVGLAFQFYAGDDKKKYLHLCRSRSW